MKFTLEYPSELPTAPDTFLRPEVIQQVATRADNSGFSAVALSEHPAPSAKWRRNGGHNTIDPVAALSFMAGVTNRIRLLTNLYVLPFRNPYMAAKSLTSVDILSKGRLIAGVGAGYLRAEFAALGVAHERRAELFDEALEALRHIWANPETAVSGADFAAPGPLWLQQPVQRPGPPIWIGGNGPAALRRVTAYGDGWMPIIADTTMAAAMRTTAIENPDQFSTAVSRLHTRLANAGRDPESVDIQVVCPHIDFTDRRSVAAAQEFLDDLGRRGATAAVVHTSGSGPDAALDFIDTFATEFDLEH